MDEEQQGLTSPIAGGLRGIRRSVSSSIFTGRSVLPQPAQPDPQTTSLLQQNSLTLTSVSEQLTGINSSILFLSNSLNSIKQNLALSDELERQREAAKQKREAILAEQGLREGKESELEKKVQSALLFPVTRVAQKAQNILSRVAEFLLILVGGWLTSQTFEFFNLKANDNIDALSRFKRKFLSDLFFLTSSFLLFGVALKKILAALGSIASRAIKFVVNNILLAPFKSVIRFIKRNIANFKDFLLKSAKKLITDAPGAASKLLKNIITNPRAIFGSILTAIGLDKIFSKTTPDGKTVGLFSRIADKFPILKNPKLLKLGKIGIGAFDIGGDIFFGRQEFLEEKEQLKEEGKDTDANIKKAGIKQTVGAIAASLASIGLILLPEPTTTVGGIISLAAILGLPIAAESGAEALVDTIIKDDKSDKSVKENNIKVNKKNDLSSVIAPVKSQNLAMADNVSNLQDPAPNLLNLNQNTSRGGSSASFAGSDGSPAQTLPQIMTSDFANTFIPLSESLFNVVV